MVNQIYTCFSKIRKLFAEEYLNITTIAPTQKITRTRIYTVPERDSAYDVLRKLQEEKVKFLFFREVSRTSFFLVFTIYFLKNEYIRGSRNRVHHQNINHLIQQNTKAPQSTKNACCIRTY